MEEGVVSSEPMRSWYMEKGGERGAQKLNARGEMRGWKSLNKTSMSVKAFKMKKDCRVVYNKAGFHTSFTIINAYCTVVECMSFMLQRNLREMCAHRRTWLADAVCCWNLLNCAASKVEAHSILFMPEPSVFGLLLCQRCSHTEMIEEAILEGQC